MKVRFTLCLMAWFFQCYAQIQFVAPLPNSTMHNPQRNIVIRPGSLLDPSSLSPSLFTIYGSVSGMHVFTVVLARDGKTINLNPQNDFALGEKVIVKMKAGLRSLDGSRLKEYSFSFFIHRTFTTEEQQLLDEAGRKWLIADIGTVGNVPLPPKQIKKKDYEITINGHPSPGSILFSSFSVFEDSTQKVRIIKNNGSSVFERSPGNQYGGFDWKLNHNQYFTAYDGEHRFNMYDSNYVFLKSFSTANGYSVDEHEFQIFPDGHYYMIAHEHQIIDMSVYDSSYQKKAVVAGNVIQEFDAERNLLFEWRSFDHIDVTEAMHVDLSAGFIDAVHMNSIEEDFDGNIIVSMRNLDQAARIDVHTGNFIWRLGGAKNEFTFFDDKERFDYQHDVHRLPNGHITLFNNNNYGNPPVSSAREYRLNETGRTAAVVWSYPDPPSNQSAPHSIAMGSVQRLPNGNTFICWGWIPKQGDFPAMTEVDRNNNMIWELKYDDSQTNLTYRAHRESWTPCSRPTERLIKTTNIKTTTATFNWNKATGAAMYYIEYRIAEGTIWRHVKVNASHHSFDGYGLFPATEYEWHIQTWCDDDGDKKSNFSSLRSFTTQGINKNLNLNESMDVRIYPNPANDHITIQWIAPQSDGETHIMIINSLGRIVLEKFLNNSGVRNFETFNLQNLPTSSYFVRIIAAGQSYKSHFIKTRGETLDSAH